MSYHTYQTEGIILSKKDIGEADRIFSILTDSFGRIDAVAQGVRYVKSKLRYNLEVLNYSRFGLTAGKDLSWRIVDAEEINNWENIRQNKKKLVLASRLGKLIDRMVRGQEPDKILFEYFKEDLFFLEKAESGTDNLRAFALLASLKILSHLGYVADYQKWEKISLEKAKKIEPTIALAVKTAIKESQL